MRIPVVIFCLLAPICHAAAAQAPNPAAGQRCIAIVGTNDVHGAIEATQIRAGDELGSIHHGGILALSGYVGALRDIYPDRLLLVDAGDIFQGTMPSNMSQGRAMISAYNTLRYDAAAVGNHEFDFGGVGTLSAHAEAESPGIDRTGVLKSRISEANFPFLANNIDDKLTGMPVQWSNLAPSTLKKVGDVTVGIVGASTPSTPWATRAQNVSHLSFAHPGPRIVREAARLRARGAELIVLVAHMGGACDMGPGDTQTLCRATPGKDHELIDVLTELPPGTVDVAVGGHTHQFMAHWLGETAIIESGAQGQHLGLIEACVAEATPARPAHIDVQRSTIHPPIEVCLTTWADGTCKARKSATPVAQAHYRGRPILPDPALIEGMRPFLQAVSAAMGRNMNAYLQQPLSAMAVGSLTAEAMRRQMRSDFGLHNGGGVRMGLGAGSLTYGKIFEALPFDNYVTQITLTGAQIVKLAQTLAYAGSRGNVTQFANLRLVGEKSGIPQVVDAKGQPLDPARIYTLSTTDFVVEGGDGAHVVLDGLSQDAIISSEVSARDAAAEFIAAQFAIGKGH